MLFLIGATSLLTMTILKMECYTNMPKISYLTALDFYMVTCYGFVVFSILEFAVVHQDKFNYQDFEMKMLEIKNSRQIPKENPKKIECFNSLTRKKLHKYSHRRPNEKVANRLVQKSSSMLSLEHEKPVVTLRHESINTLDKNNRFIDLYKYSVKINNIDHVAKVAFPILFVLFNVGYFFFHTYKRKLF